MTKEIKNSKLVSVRSTPMTAEMPSSKEFGFSAMESTSHPKGTSGCKRLWVYIK